MKLAMHQAHADPNMDTASAWAEGWNACLGWLLNGDTP